MWRNDAECAADGDYTATLNVWHRDHSANLTATAHFSLRGKECYCLDDEGQVVSTLGKESPPASLALLICALAACGVRRRVG